MAGTKAIEVKGIGFKESVSKRKGCTKQSLPVISEMIDLRASPRSSE